MAHLKMETILLLTNINLVNKAIDFNNKNMLLIIKFSSEMMSTGLA